LLFREHLFDYKSHDVDGRMTKRGNSGRNERDFPHEMTPLGVSTAGIFHGQNNDATDNGVVFFKIIILYNLFFPPRDYVAQEI